MDRMISFTHAEKEIQPKFREGVNTAENVLDLEKHYSHSMVAMLQKIVGDSLRLVDSDVTFSPSADGFFTLHSRIRGNQEIRRLLDHSDLSKVLGRFAASINRRYQHLKKQPGKTRLKIRN